MPPRNRWQPPAGDNPASGQMPPPALESQGPPPPLPGGARNPNPTGPRRKMRGARPTPKASLMSAPPFCPKVSAPPMVAMVPSKLSVWGNDSWGCCVSSEEAFAKACYSPELFVPEDLVIQWARQHGYLNGADLLEVMRSMQTDGFRVGESQWNDGAPMRVNFAAEWELQNALATGPVKIGIDANALPGGAGDYQGWWTLRADRHYNEDHCVALCGYGKASELFQAMGLQLPQGLPAEQPGYLLFTWGTIGFVTYQWLMGTCGEAWIRNPTTVILGPGPTPPPPPPPPPSPGPVTGSATLTVNEPLQPGTYVVGAAPGPQVVVDALGAELRNKFAPLVAAGAIDWKTVMEIIAAIVAAISPFLKPGAASPVALRP